MINSIILKSLAVLFLCPECHEIKFPVPVKRMLHCCDYVRFRVGTVTEVCNMRPLTAADKLQSEQ